MSPEASRKKSSFDWAAFSRRMHNSFRFYSKYSRLPINADRWEEIIFTTLRDMGETYQGGEPKWIPGSHVPGADVWVDTFSISAKSGSIKNGFLNLSSYRLTRFAGLPQMITFLDSSEAKNFDFYLCCARANTSKELIYRVYKVAVDVFEASKMRWVKTPGGWNGRGKKGVNVMIVKNMSNQLWISVPLELCELITEFKIPLSKWGATTIPTL